MSGEKISVKAVAHEEPVGLWAAATNPGPRCSETVEPGKITYHCNSNGREFDVVRSYVPGWVVSEAVREGKNEWSVHGPFEFLHVDLGGEDYVSLSWARGDLTKGKIHRAGKENAIFMFGWDFDRHLNYYYNPHTGHAYTDDDESGKWKKCLSEEAAKKEILDLIRPYVKMREEYIALLKRVNLPAQQFRMVKGTPWKVPKLPLALSPTIAKIKRLFHRS